MLWTAHMQFPRYFLRRTIHGLVTAPCFFGRRLWRLYQYHKPSPFHNTVQAFSAFHIKDEIEVSIRVLALTIMAEFEDFLPIMAQKLGEREFMAELCNGFRLLADPRLGLITLESLKKNSGLLGLDSLTDSELRAMMQEGDLDGNGALNEHEFCVLMIRLSPSLMDEAYKWLNNTLENDLEEFPNAK